MTLFAAEAFEDLTTERLLIGQEVANCGFDDCPVVLNPCPQGMLEGKQSRLRCSLVRVRNKRAIGVSSTGGTSDPRGAAARAASSPRMKGRSVEGSAIEAASRGGPCRPHELLGARVLGLDLGLKGIVPHPWPLRLRRSPRSSPRGESLLSLGIRTDGLRHDCCHFPLLLRARCE